MRAFLLEHDLPEVKVEKEVRLSFDLAPFRKSEYITYKFKGKTSMEKAKQVYKAKKNWDKLLNDFSLSPMSCMLNVEAEFEYGT